MAYQPIPRKYRPQKFSDIVGQGLVVTTLKNALRLKKIAHAYLFCGCKGTGKTTFARLFAKALNCGHLTDEMEPCNQCPSCLEITAGRSLDVMEIDGASNRGIDDIRQINETVGYAPAHGKYKIYIIDEVHMLTKEAFNALLKTLEEPPSGVKFFFATTEPHKVLPTILSRCQRFDLQRIPLQQIHAKLASIAADLQVDVEAEALQLIAHLSEGSLRDAESLLDQVICYSDGAVTAAGTASRLGLMPRSAFFALDEAIYAHHLPFAFELSEQLFSAGKDLSAFLDELMEHFRTLLSLKLKSSSLAFLNEHEKQLYEKSASFYTQEQCLYLLDYLVQSASKIPKSLFKRAGFEMVLLHLLQSRRRISLDALVQRLIELEGKVAASPSPAAGPAPLPVPAPVQAQSDLEERLLSAMKKKISSPPSPPPAAPVDQAPPPSKPAPIQPSIQPSVQQPGKYDTMMRFAAIELEGTLKKD